MVARVRFELTNRINDFWVSKPVHSTALPSRLVDLYTIFMMKL